MEGKSILITGGTGSFGHAFARYALDHLNPRKVIVFSRDEFKQFEMRKRFPDPRMRFFIGDVRDKERLRMAFRDVDIVIHAAALKHVPLGEITPDEFIKTNVIGSQNVVGAAINMGIPKVVALSTDKAVSPANLYGATKTCAEKLFIAANVYQETKFSVVRYGNVAGSRGSVIPLFLEMAKTGTITITDTRMTRFVMEIGEAVKLVVTALEWMAGGEIFIPKLESMYVTRLAQLIGKHRKHEITGIRPGEKLAEWLIAPEETRNTLDYIGHYKIIPEADWYKGPPLDSGTAVDPDFAYSSKNTDKWATDERLRQIISDVEKSAT